MKRTAVGCFLLLAMVACGPAAEAPPVETRLVPANAETDPMSGWGDRADDPALWVHPTRPELSLILGTNKDEGLYVYDLDGRERQRLLVGRVNNVDVRREFAVASNDEAGGLSWFHISTAQEEVIVTHVGDTPVERAEPYGVCVGILDDTMLAGVTYKDGTVELWEVTGTGEQLPAVKLVRQVALASQLEGCVFDDLHKRLFVGEEGVGIWSLDLGDGNSSPMPLDTIASGSGLVGDVEGLSLYAEPDGSGYLVASAQEANRFVIYDRLPPHRARAAISIAASADGKIDAVTHTDGIDISASPLPQYPRGILIVQDDANSRYAPGQNFKIVDWRDVEAAFQGQ